ncbi:GH1 family beta-glucosidase [Paracoccaceae bacterium GXU_MW_L88]
MGMITIPDAMRRDFTFGVATASYQVEGALDADGRLESIWDVFAATPGKTRNGESGDPACDHYHRWEADLDLIADLGFDLYRFSIAWPRVMHRDGTRNKAGIAFYRNILEGLKARGIKASVTLYHWDLPQWMEERGGWTNRETAYRFADYAEMMATEFRGLVDQWITVNEPWVSAWLGYGVGVHAPGRADPKLARQAAHHLLLAHALGLEKLRAIDPDTPAGIALNLYAVYGAAPGAEEAALLANAYQNDWFLGPLFGEGYPAALDRLWPNTAPLILDGDMENIRAPMDFLGINTYTPLRVSYAEPDAFREFVPDGAPTTTMGWEIFPDSMRDMLLRTHQTYPDLPPLYVTENGCSLDDALVDGEVNDQIRIKYFTDHLAAAADAMAEGVDLRGYYVWSFLDNFEWAEGYAKRFGIVHVSYDTQERTLKNSALNWKSALAGRHA